MDEQKKRELMLKAAVQFKGVWPSDDATYIVSVGRIIYPCKSRFGQIIDTLSGDNLSSKMQELMFAICTRTEFETFIDSLFEGAPDDATHYRAEDNTFIKCDSGWYKCQDEKWIGYFGGLSPNCVDSLIPRPRKQPEFLGDAMRKAFDKAWNEAVNKVPNTPTMNDDVSYVRMDGGEWSGEGLPPVGTECVLRNDQDFDIEYGKHLVGQNVFVESLFSVNGGSIPMAAVSYHGNCYCFRQSMLHPLKTEAEKERDKLYKEVFRFIEKDRQKYEGTYGISDAIEALIDADLIDKSAFYD